MNFKLFALVGIFLIGVLSEPANAARLEQGRMDDRPNYVVIGAFRVYKNAIRFTAHAHKDLKMDAKFELNPHRKLYYVYVLSTADQSLAINEAKRLREESEFRDTWVYFGALGERAAALGENYIGQDINPVTTQKIDNIKIEVGSEEKQDGAPEGASNTAMATSDSIQTVVSDEKPQILDETTGKNFLFKVFRTDDSTAIDGDIVAIDTEKTRKMGTYKANVPVKLPNTKIKQVSFVCEVFGYRKVQRDVEYNNLEAEGIVRDENGAAIVPFELVRLQKGDIAVMYNVYFFKDAAIMRPESRYEISSLLEMLIENPKYKIRLHGHTNGGATGKIISMAKESQNFFSLNNTKDGFGSARQLSEERAEVIRRYLITNAVDPSRIEVKAWGGKRPIHDKHSTRAQENVRVEVEILED
ncbi:MAG TPA: OmpA family protein [Chryseolinea sp.]|nr:OmpA family protein [Chryseolinea sp.]